MTCSTRRPAELIHDQPSFSDLHRRESRSMGRLPPAGHGPGITSRSSRNQDQTKLWQGLLTLPLGLKVSNPKPGGRPRSTESFGDPPNRQLEIRKLFPARSLVSPQGSIPSAATSNGRVPADPHPGPSPQIRDRPGFEAGAGRSVSRYRFAESWRVTAAAFCHQLNRQASSEPCRLALIEVAVHASHQSVKHVARAVAAGVAVGKRPARPSGPPGTC